MKKLPEAIEYFSGGAYKPNTYNSKWQSLQKRLEDNNYTAGEFCYFCVHHLMNSYDPSVLIKTNLITCDKTWESFEKYKDGRSEEIDRLVHTQRKEYVTKKRRQSLDLLLTDPRIYMNPLVRVDLACKDLDHNSKLFKRIIDTYSEEADYLLNGNPEYEKHVKLWIKYKEQN